MPIRLTRRQRRKLLSALISIVILLVVAWLQRTPAAQQDLQDVLGDSDPGTYAVTDLADGDTITVDMNGRKEKVRMIGVDTPETHHPQKPVQCFGEAAAAYTKVLIGSSRVRLEADPLNTNRDRYDRLLRYVYLPDGRLVNAEIIKGGYGFAYTAFPFSKLDEFRGYEQAAREAGTGLWGSCTATTTPNGSVQSDYRQ